MKIISIILYSLLTIIWITQNSFSTEAEVCSYFTGFFIGSSSSEFDKTFNTLKNDPGFNDDLLKWTQDALGSIPQLNFRALDLRTTRTGSDKIKTGPNTLFIRGFISRADIKEIESFSITEFVFTTTVTLEFFNLVTGEVFYTRSFSGQGPLEAAKATGLSEERKKESFRKCVDVTVKAIVKHIGENYKPGIIEGNIVSVLDSVNVVLDIGRLNGLYQGMTFYVFNGKSDLSCGILKTGNPQNRICMASILFTDGLKPERGWHVKSFGTNVFVKHKNFTRYMVAGFSAANPDDFDPDFKVDEQTLGQWLHDGLSQKTDFFMLAPLLVSLDSSDNLEMQEAMYEAQVNFAVSGGASQSKITGKRVFPDIMIKGIITHANVQNYSTYGADNKIVSIGVSIEMYDRKTRDFIFSCRHSGKKVEKIVMNENKIYRNVDLYGTFRDLCKSVILEACEKTAAEYRPYAFQGEVQKVVTDNEINVRFSTNSANKGDLFNVIKLTDRIKGLDGGELGRLWHTYGISRLIERKNDNTFVAKIVVSDGATPVEEGDILRIEGKNEKTIAGKLYQVAGWEKKGDVTREYEYSLPLLSEWLHDALLEEGKYRLLPPDFRMGEMGTAEAALTSGEFKRIDQREIIFQGTRDPEILIYGRLGLARVSKKSRAAKDIVELVAGVQISFVDLSGDTLYTGKLAGTRELEQIQERGKVMIGSENLTSDFNSLTRNTINELVKKTGEEYKPVNK